MINVDWPAATRGQPRDHEVAEGPFVVEHKGATYLGAHMEWNGTDLMFWDGSRGHLFDKTYTADVFGDTVTFDSAEYNSTYEFRPLTMRDAEWALPGQTVSSLDELNREVLGMIDATLKS